MKNIFQKSDFPEAPGGNLYEWKKAETMFEIPHDGLYAIKIDAACKGAGQNKSTDDDDLRVALDGYDFGKYEQAGENEPWKSFNTSASWNGATLKGGTKTIYYFLNLNKGGHTLQFFSDEKPSLKNIEIFEITDYSFELADLTPSEKIKCEKTGIPWIAFVFLGMPGKNITLGVETNSGKNKGGTDGDNLKVVVNGRTINNQQAPSSDKYKNFYFSGDLKVFDVLTITDEQLAKPLAFENAVELWYDEEPEITNLKINFFDEEDFLNNLKSLGNDDLRQQILNWAYLSISWFRISGKKYSAEFLSHAIETNPKPLLFQASDPIVSIIRKDPVYEKIVAKLKAKISAGNFNGEIWPDDFTEDKEMNGEINFGSKDLSTSLHGIHKIEYHATKKDDDRTEVEMTIFDVYDFKQEFVPFLRYDLMINNLLDRGEEFGIIHNFEIEIRINEKIYAI